MAQTTNAIHAAREQASSPVRANRLARELSPYLLQHANNPVDWYPWGEEALSRARKENKPIFLSIGYSACHWCHVMEHESFEDPEIAETLKGDFISIKVDREERPDLDEIYMTAVQLMTGSGGWPLTVFLTPDLKPFFGGTYFPPDDRYGRPGFRRVLEEIAKTWRENPGGVSDSADRLARAIQSSVGREAAASAGITVGMVAGGAQELERHFDGQWGGFGPAPKFPSSDSIGLLLRQHAQTGEQKLLDMATTTLDRMACGGMYDQVGGGFHRYATDREWLVPHFEKMLYDNALLARVYLEAWQVTGKTLYRRIATEIFEYVLRDMTDPRGGFHSSEDADSEGEEGKYYVWRPQEIRDILGQEDAAFFNDYYGVTEQGNFEGANILHVPRDPTEVSQNQGLSPDQLQRRLSGLHRKLLGVREKRVRPGKDDKVIAAWNGMMISAFARGYQVLGDERYRTAAERAADFVLSEMTRDGLLLRVYRGQGHEQGVSKLPAYLDDYAEMAHALIDLYEATFDLRWLEASDRFTQRMLADFWDAEQGGFFYTSTEHHKNLLVRTKPYYDGAVPSGNSTATLVLLRLAELLGNSEYDKKAEATLTSASRMMQDQPRGHMSLLCAADFALRERREIAVVGNPDSDETRRILDVIHSRFIPNKVLALVDRDGTGAAEAENRIPLLQYKSTIPGKTTVYVCKDRKCKRPVTDAAALSTLLDKPDESPKTGSR